jgi:hypothetical protein
MALPATATVEQSTATGFGGRSADDRPQGVRNSRCVANRDGVDEPNIVGKDTALVLTGETVDILLDATNPGRWMADAISPNTTRAG